MDITALREAMHAEPFRPFTLRLADGRSLQVPHPDFLAVSARRAVFISPVDESLTILEPLLIVSVEIPGVTAPSSGNGTAGGG